MMDSEARGFKGGMNCERHVQILRRREDRVVARVAMRDARDRKWTNECAFASVLYRALEFARGFGRVAERDMRNRNQLAGGVPAKVRYPTIVSAAVRTRQLRVEKFGLPEQSDGRIQNRALHPFLLEQIDAFLHVHGAERRALEVGFLGLRRHHARLLRLDRGATHRSFAQLFRVFDLLAHPAERGEQAGLRHLRALVIDFEILEAVVADPDSHRSLAIFRIDVLFPEIGWFEDMSVAI